MSGDFFWFAECGGLLLKDIGNQRNYCPPSHDVLVKRRVGLDCLKLTAGGKKGNEIAKLLVLSEQTVNNLTSSVTKKLDCTTRTQAVVSALRLNIIRV